MLKWKRYIFSVYDIDLSKKKKYIILQNRTKGKDRNMIKIGLVSISFRDLFPKQIVDMVAEVGLDAIEWGGDVHVPHGDSRGRRSQRFDC